MKDERLRFDLSRPWVVWPDDSFTIVSLIRDHKEVEDACDDHTVAACTCGANRGRLKEIDHLFDWDRHFGELWNAALDEMGL